RQYSKNAMPQLMMITAVSGADLNLRCPYQAKVMKMFDRTNRPTGIRRSIRAGMAGLAGVVAEFHVGKWPTAWFLAVRRRSTHFAPFHAFVAVFTYLSCPP